MSDIERPRRRVAEEVPAIRVARLRRLARPWGDDGRLRLVIQAPAGRQAITLLPRWRGFGYTYEAECRCGHRALVLRLDERSGWFRCAHCLHLRSARSRFWQRRWFQDVVLPLLLLERARRKVNYHNAPKVRREAFAAIESSTLDDLGRKLEDELAGELEVER